MGHFVSTSAAEKAKVDESVANFVLGVKLPFRVVEHPLFIAMVDRLHPGYKPPTRKSISNTHLDNTYTKLQSKMKSELEGKTVTMQQDGWSTPANEPVISTSVTCDGVGYFVDAQLTGSKSKTAEACQEMLTESKAFAEKTFGCKVRSVVTDNAPAMAKMRAGLEEDNQDLITYGCLAHHLNLIMKDINDAKLPECVEKIQRHFCNKHIPTALLADFKESVRPRVSADTRWSSQLDCYDTYIKNRSCMISIIQEHPGVIEKSIQTAIMDNNLYFKVVEMVKILRPISVALLRAQVDSTSLADGYDIMNRLMADPAVAPVHDKIKKR